jgi:hypothetical protein
MSLLTHGLQAISGRYKGRLCNIVVVEEHEDLDKI